jgi:hypothetical protein
VVFIFGTLPFLEELASVLIKTRMNPIREEEKAHVVGGQV